MLASSAPSVADALAKAGGGAEVAVDVKLDGIRIQVHRSGDDVLVATRSLDDITARLPGGGRGGAVAAGDVVRARRRGAGARRRRPAAAVPGDGVAHGDDRRASCVTPYFFDVLHLDGDDLLDAPASERAEALERLVPPEHRVPRLVTAVAAEAEAFLDRHARLGPRGRRGEVADRAVRRRPPRRLLGEGQAGAHPRPRRARGRVGLRPARGLAVQHPPRRPRPGHRRAGDARQDVQGDDRRDARLADRAVHRARALPATIRDSYVVEVRPEQVVEIAFDGVQRSTRYPGGVALRFARVVRYRDDKPVAEIDTIETVRGYLS